MLQSSAAVRHAPGQRREPRLTPVRAAPAAPVAALTLPSIAGIPREITQETGSKVAASAALALLDLGHLTEADASDKGSIADLVSIGIGRALAKQVEELSICPLDIHVTEEHREHTGTDLVVLWGSPNMNDAAHLFTLARKTTALERAHRGLGETALDYLCAAWSSSVNHYFLPCQAMQYAAHHWWNGYEDENQLIEEMRDNGERPEDFEIRTRAEFDRSLPEWVRRHRRVVKRGALQRLARSRANRLENKVARVCLDIHALAADPDLGSTCTPCIHWADEDTVGYSVFARWTADDVCGPLVDTHMELMSQLGGIEALGFDGIDASTASVRDWLRRAEKLIRMVKLAEQLTFLLGEDYL